MKCNLSIHIILQNKNINPNIYRILKEISYYPAYKVLNFAVICQYCIRNKEKHGKDENVKKNATFSISEKSHRT